MGNRLIAIPRAIDNQVFFGMCSPARDLSAGYHAVRRYLLILPTGLTIADRIQWGHSLVVDPMCVFSCTGESLSFADLLFSGGTCLLRLVTRKISSTFASVIALLLHTHAMG